MGSADQGLNRIPNPRAARYKLTPSGNRDSTFQVRRASG